MSTTCWGPDQHHKLLSPTLPLCSLARPALLLAPGPCWDRKQDRSLTGPSEHIPHPIGLAHRAAGQAETHSHPMTKPTGSQNWLQLPFLLHLWFLQHHPIQALNYASNVYMHTWFQKFLPGSFPCQAKKKKKKAALKSSSPSTSKKNI